MIIATDKQFKMKHFLQRHPVSIAVLLVFTLPIIVVFIVDLLYNATRVVDAFDQHYSFVIIFSDDSKGQQNGFQIHQYAELQKPNIEDKYVIYSTYEFYYRTLLFKKLISRFSVGETVDIRRVELSSDSDYFVLPKPSFKVYFKKESDNNRMRITIVGATSSFTEKAELTIPSGPIEILCIEKHYICCHTHADDGHISAPEPIFKKPFYTQSMIVTSALGIPYP